ncbi:MAG: tetratricopeptide repeat protein [Roseivirga sp.]|nr:tetratricopeptide repeat protein [Roseivirga sp.]
MIQLQRYDMALKEITELLMQYPEHPELHFLMGECHQAKKSLSEAKRSFEKTISIQPEHVRALNALGGISLELNDNSRAKTYFETALTIAPYESALYGNLGRLYLKARDYKKAIGYAEEGLSLYPQDEHCLNTLFWAYSLQGNHGRANSILRENLRNNPENIETLTNLGHEFYRKDDYAQSEQVFSSLLLLNANNETSIEGFKRASTANNWLTKTMTNKRIARDAQKWITLSVLLVALLRHIPGFPVKVYWLLIPFLVQVFALFTLILGIGKLLAYQRQKRLRAQFTFQEMVNAIVLVSLFLAFLVTITLTGVGLATKDAFPIELFLASLYFALFQVSFGIRMDWFVKSLLVRRTLLTMAISFALIALLWTDQWWLPFSLSILTLILDVAHFKGCVFRKWN